MKTPAFYIKASVLAALLFVESYLLSSTIVEFISSQRYFNPPVEMMVRITALQIAIIVTSSLLAGAWDKWEQYIFSPLPIASAIFLIALPVNSSYALILAFVVYLLMSYEVFMATNLKSQMLSFNPRLILKFSSRGIILTFSIAAAVLTILSAGTEPQLDVGETVGDFVDKYLTNEINNQINSQFQGSLDQVSQQVMEQGPSNIFSEFGLEENSLTELGVSEEELAQFGLTPEDLGAGGSAMSEANIFGNLMDFGSGSGGFDLSKLAAPQLSLKDTVTSQVNNIIEPYKRFINPIMALLAFGLLQFLGMIAYWIYNLTVDVVFWIAKKSGFLKVEKVPAEQEIIHF